MPDRRRHRGPHPEDARLFGVENLPTLRAAVDDFCWMLTRGYAHDSSLKLVGDRYNLVARQRTAVSRCCCSDADLARRQSHQVGTEQLSGAVLWLDGYNVLTTIEAALAGGVILAARDGTYRDMASMHGSYRKVAETIPALDLLGRTIAALVVAECRWLLDQPVSNSGLLKSIMQEMAAARGWRWQVELTPNPDAVLIAMDGAAVQLPCEIADGVAVELPPQRTGLSSQRIVVVTADSAILDRCPAWFSLARETITRHVPEAWMIKMLQEPPPTIDPSARNHTIRR
jgi:hypothetical protein